MVNEGKCLCGKPMIGKALLPIGNVYAGLVEVKDWYPVCEYHAEKARQKGHEVV